MLINGIVFYGTLCPLSMFSWLVFLSQENKNPNKYEASTEGQCLDKEVCKGGTL